MKKIIRQLGIGLLSTTLLVLSSISIAEDIEIFQTEKSTIPPNILFVLDGSGSMDEMVGLTGVNRMETVKTALKTLIGSIDKVNIGLMSFANSTQVGSVELPYDPNHLVHGPTYPISAIKGDTDGDGIQDQTAEDVLRSNPLFTTLTDSFMPEPTAGENTQDYLEQVIDQWAIGGGTPIPGALFEAAKYLRGENIHWGNKAPNSIEAAHPSTYKLSSMIADGSTIDTTSCSASFGLETCVEGSTCTVARNYSCGVENGPSYQSDTDVAGHACTLNNPSPWTNCPKGQTVCGIGPASDCTFTVVPELNQPNKICSLGSVAACNAQVEFSNCTSATAEGSTVATIYCDKKTPAWDRYRCPAQPKPQLYTCFTPVNKCKQNKCQTEKLAGPKYHSPINKECQNNTIILLSDGGPSINKSSGLITDMIGTAAKNCKNTPKPADLYDWGSAAAVEYYGRCGKELASFLANTDNSATDLGHDVAGDQAINLYTIGFALDSEPFAKQYLNDLATAGGGASYIAGDEANLIEAFKAAVDASLSKPREFSSPTYQVNQSQSLLHAETVYLPVFNAQGGPRWIGNLKKFKQVNGIMKDVNDDNVYDANGDLLKTAVDFWAAGSVNHAVKQGGAASQLDPANRSVLTDSGAGSLVALDTVSEAQLGVTAAEKDAVINFAKGFATNGVTARNTMGDIIHSKPIYFPYSGLTFSTTSKAKAGGIVFIGTNEGYLHAINDSDGSEVFAYMPEELLKNINTLKTNDSAIKHPYGVDGPMTLRFEDANHDGQVDSGDKVILYFGLRRGGKSYYALDITNPNDPKLKWKISADTIFNELGYTWSAPKLEKLRYGTDNTAKPVLIFGGGYVDDNGGEADNSGTGSNVYIVNADTGALVWKSGDARIGYAVAGNIRPVDVDRDGAIDRLYFGDTGGTVWRVDLNVGAAQATDDYGTVKARVVAFAELGGTATPRRAFFNEPDVAIFRRNGQVSLTVAIGSGNRPKPLQMGADDRFFVLFDQNPLTVPAGTVAALTVSDLSAHGSTTIKPGGWYLDFVDSTVAPIMKGEKVLSTALTFQNNVMFTTFGEGDTTIVPTAANNCDISSGNQSRIYILDLLTGKGTLDLDTSKTGNEIWVKGKSGMIMETPQVIYTKMESHKTPGGACTKGDCVRGFTIPGVATNNTPGAGAGLANSLPRVYWLNKD